MGLRSIFFDLDNTLIDYERAFKQGILYSYDYFCQKVWRIEKPADDLYWFNIFKFYCDEYYTDIEKGICTKQQYRQRRFIDSMNQIGVNMTKRAANDFHEYFYSIIDRFVKPYQGVTDLLQYLRNQRIKVGLITNGSTQIQLQKIKRIGLYQWIDPAHIFISDYCNVAKPDKKIFKLAESIIENDQSRPLYIGDSWELDIVGAINAGWEAIYLNTRNKKPSTNHVPLAICSKFKDLKDIIKEKESW